VNLEIVNEEAMMRDQKYEARLSALRLWADMVTSRGYVPPAPADLAAIAEHKRTDTPGVDQTLVGPWRDALKELLKQLAFNIADPHLQLSPEFDQPGPGALRLAEARSTVPSASSDRETIPAGSPAVDPAFLALKMWRNKAIEENRLSPSNLKEAQLRLLVNSGQTTEEEIRSTFPPAVARYAGEMARVLTGLHPAGAAGEAGTLPEPATGDAVPASNARPQAASSHAAPMRSVSPVPPAPANAPAGTQEAITEPFGGVEIDPSSFAAFDYGPQTPAQANVEVRKDSQGRRWYSWPPAQTASPVKIYRLVSNDEHEPYAPDQADPVAATVAAETVDDRPFSTAARYFQVWLNEGPGVAEAMASQPTLYARGQYVGEVRNLEIREDEGRVVGRWNVLPGTQKVQIFRIPIERAATGGGDQRYRIQPDLGNLGGFVDADAERGKAYLYQVCAEAAVGDDIRLSSPMPCTIRVSAVLEPVNDMRIEMSRDNESSLFDLRWSIPAGGSVVVYRTEQPPQAGLELKPLSEDSLRISGLMPESRLPNPVEAVDGGATMLSIPWPSGWTRAYFTPVTLLQGMAHVGTVIFKSRNDKVRNPRILERINSQILTFEWPDGADSVMVYSGPAGQDPELSLNSQAVEISQPDYRRRGGLHFAQPLPSKGCDLHLVPVTFEAGARVPGAITTVNYPHILRLNYQVVAVKSLLGKLTGVSVTVQTPEAGVSMPAFVLVFNPDRLPLTSRDGTALNMVPNVDGAAAPARRFTPDAGSGPDGPVPWKTDPGSWTTEVKPEGGFVRLFADLPVNVLRHVALLDPPITSLRLTGAPNRVKGFFGGR
jgi:hypothetical protein